MDEVYKIKDSVDLFLTDNKYITVYFMNSRKRKTFKVNDLFLEFIKLIDGENSVGKIFSYLENKYEITRDNFDRIFYILKNENIITKINTSNLLSEIELNRYSRQINYMAEFLSNEEDAVYAQYKIMNTKVLLFGCGSIGGNIALQLAMAGVNNITLFDYDSVEPSDISRHMYYKYAYNNTKKTYSLKEELLKINANIKIKIINDNMYPEYPIEDIVENHDFIINTLDEPYIGYTSAKISRICIKYKKPHYICGGFDAHLASTGELIVPYITPCVECYASYFKTSLKDWKPTSHPVTHRIEEIGGLSSMSLFSSSYASLEILKYISGILKVKDYKVRGEFIFKNMDLIYLNILKDPNCIVCGG